MFRKSRLFLEDKQRQTNELLAFTIGFLRFDTETMIDYLKYVIEIKLAKVTSIYYFQKIKIQGINKKTSCNNRIPPLLKKNEVVNANC